MNCAWPCDADPWDRPLFPKPVLFPGRALTQDRAPLQQAGLRLVPAYANSGQPARACHQLNSGQYGQSLAR